MNRFLQFFNLLGILLLAILCAWQWKTNSWLSAELIEMHKKADDQATTIARQTATIKEDAADLAEYRGRLNAAEEDLTQTRSNLAKAQAACEQVTAERNQLANLRDQFVAALTARDAALKQETDVIRKQADSIHQLEGARDDVIRKYNDLVVKFNADKQ